MSKPIEVRLQITHPKKTETDFYITRDIVVLPFIERITKVLSKHKKITLHSTGAANYKALKIAAMLQKKQNGAVLSEVSTSTIEVSSYVIPVKEGEERTKKDKNINGVTIVLSLKE